MKLIHCSDLHLDSPMGTNLPLRQAKERSDEMLQTFSRLVHWATEHGVTAVLIAGDLFDSQQVSPTALHYVLDQIRLAPDVDFLYLRGNHDHTTQGLPSLPPNLKLFSDHWITYSYGDVRITGAEFTPENGTSLYSSLDLDPGFTNIVTLHGQISSSPGEDLVCLPALRGRGIDYLALGHIHAFQEGKLDLNSRYCYCGCLEGRGYDECGEKGFVLLNIGSHEIQSRFVPFACRTVQSVSVDISGLSALSDLEAAVMHSVAHIPRSSLIRVALTGSYTPDTQKDLSFLRSRLETEFYAVKLVDESKLFLSPQSYENDISLKGEFIRLVMHSGLSGSEKEKIICTGLQALTGEAITL